MYNEISGVEFGLGDISGVEFGATVADELRAALSGSDEIGADELMGALEEMGLDGDTLGALVDEVGARRSRRGRRGGGYSQAQRHAANMRARQTAAAVAAASQRPGAHILGGFGSMSNVNVNARPQKVAGRYLPIESAAIAAGAAGVVTLSPQEDFRPERLIYAGVANTFSITGVSIKNQPQALSVGNAPADAFSANAVDQRLNFTACPVGGQIQIGLLNFSGAAATFRGMFVGSAAIQV